MKSVFMHPLSRAVFAFRSDAYGATLRTFFSWILLLPLTAQVHGVTPNAPQPTVTKVKVDAAKPVGLIGNLFNVGYDGFGELTIPAVTQGFTDLGMKYFRLPILLDELCGEKPGEYRWDAVMARDQGLDIVARIRKIQSLGMTPLLVFGWHGFKGFHLPSWIHGDEGTGTWMNYNLDGSKAPTGYGDQLPLATRIARDFSAYLVSSGLQGMRWETIYEMDGPRLVDLHHAVAKGIKESDPTAWIIGPATWPGFSVEEAFVKPYLAKYGPTLLDGISIHWYANNDHSFWELKPGLMDGSTLFTMADKPLLKHLMNETPSYGTWVKSLDALLKDKSVNPSGKKFEISYTEADVNSTSYYKRNPVNKHWPQYNPETDIYHNTNYFGGVWWASVLCHVAATGTGADVAKYNGRFYYGVVDWVPPDKAYRYPVWFAMKLLGERGGLKAGRQMLQAQAAGEGASALESFATGSNDDLRIIVINKTFLPQAAEIEISSLADGNWTANTYLFDQTRVAPFIGKKPDSGDDEGTYKGYPDDSSSEPSLLPTGELQCTSLSGKMLLPTTSCPPISFTVHTLQRAPK